MKKLLTSALAVSLVLSLCVLSGCGEKKYSYDDLDLTEYITLPDYNSFEAKAPEVNITDDDIEAEIKSRLEAAAETVEVTEGTVAEGDTVKISYKGTLEDGTSPDTMKSDGATVTLGSGKLIPGFEEGLYGATIGDTVTLNLNFPDPYEPDETLSGKPVTFEVTVLSKNEENVPELNEEFVKNTSEYNTVEEYRTSVAKYLEEQEYASQMETLKEEFYTRLVDETVLIKYPDGYVEAREKKIDEDTREQVESYGYEFADFLEANDMTEDDYTEAIHGFAEEYIKQEMIIFLVARQEEIEITDEEYDEYLQSILASTGLSDEDAFEETYGVTLEEYGEDADARVSLLMMKELDTIYERLMGGESAE